MSAPLYPELLRTGMQELQRQKEWPIHLAHRGLGALGSGSYGNGDLNYDRYQQRVHPRRGNWTRASSPGN
ncbi:Uncharacterised protein [Streptococcus pneumoniae]|mgnify:CR=1|nr:Uncharacterised protein [Streptococcus pneumoniae]